MPGTLRRPTSEEIDLGILDAAAGLFAQFGYEHTSVQRIADEVGYSKTGLLHRFSSKDSIRDAVFAYAIDSLTSVAERVQSVPEGHDRDRQVIEALLELALGHPGVAAFLLSPVTQEPTEDTAAFHETTRQLVDALFETNETTSVARRVQVIAALGALAVGGFALRDLPGPHAREALISACCAALSGA